MRAAAFAGTRALAVTETRQATLGGGQSIVSGTVTRPLLDTLALPPEALNVGGGAQEGLTGAHVAVQLTVPVSHSEPRGSYPGGGTQMDVMILNVPRAPLGSSNEPLISTGGVVLLNA